MIYIRRSVLPENETAELGQWQDRANAFPPGDKGIQTAWKDFVATELGESVRERARCDAKLKCVYCEAGEGGVLEHFYPKDRYPNREFRWENINWSCWICNSGKNRRFQLDESGQPKLLDPTNTPNVSSYFYVDPDLGIIQPRLGLTEEQEERARYTIDVLRLDRDLLRRNRVRTAIAIRASLMAFSANSTDENHRKLLDVALDSEADMRQVVIQILNDVNDIDIQICVERCLSDPTFGPLVREYILS